MHEAGWGGWRNDAHEFSPVVPKRRPPPEAAERDHAGGTPSTAGSQRNIIISLSTLFTAHDSALVRSADSDVC